MPKANAIDLAKTLRKLKTGNFEFFHILTWSHWRSTGSPCYVTSGYPLSNKDIKMMLYSQVDL